MTESLLNTQPQLSVDPNKDYLEELVGEGKKFKTVADLARGKYEADLHVALKNREFDALSKDYAKLREDYNAAPKLQEVLDKLLAGKDTSSNNDTQMNEDTRREPAFDPAEFDSKIETKFQEIEAKRKSQQNWNTVKDRLQERFGDRYPDMLATQTQKLGLTAERVDDLAKTSPSAFFKLMGLDDTQAPDTFQSPPRTTQNATAFAPSTNKARKWSDWRDLQKKQPSLFSDPKAHNQMMADIKAIGEKAFYDI